MTSLLKLMTVLITALWVGGLFWIGFVVAPYLFYLAEHNSPLVPHSGAAADLIGPLLYASYALSLVLAVVLFVLLLILRKRKEIPLGGPFFLSEICLAVAFLSTVANEVWCSPKIATIRQRLNEQFGGFHLTDHAEPLYQTFKTYHLISVLLFGVCFVGVTVCLLCVSQFRERAPQRTAD